MAKVGEIISSLRILIREHSDDSGFSDAHLYHIAASARTLLFKRKVDRFKKISDWEWQTFCIALVKDKSHNCDCVTVGCDVLKSEFDLPRVMTSRNKDLIRVTTLGGKEIPLVPERDQLTLVYDPVMKYETTASIISRRLVIWNNLRLKAIQVAGLWEDISEWDGIQLCDKDGDPGDCFDFYNSEFSIDGDLLYPMYQLCLDLLKIPLTLREDITNDTSNVIRQ